ncbi:hypothetical protein PCANB_001552 [Pneumocystis canis]|nr:hypothetical protein PCK1_001549 [Pneumocystis canis]KAG5439253.1 hypothetical protein PCANB_001552 [Pneumocystis canis]
MMQFREERPTRSLPNPIAKTDSAREALQSFFCKLCDKGYQRISDYENHLSSYEHNHRKRFREMREMQKVSFNLEKQRRQGQKKRDSEIMLLMENQCNESSIKKVGFRKVFGNTDCNSTDSIDSTIENFKETCESSNIYQPNNKKGLSIQSMDHSPEDDHLYDPYVPTSP